jgi:hypothetical protein
VRRRWHRPRGPTHARLAPRNSAKVCPPVSAVRSSYLPVAWAARHAGMPHAMSCRHSTQDMQHATSRQTYTVQRWPIMISAIKAAGSRLRCRPPVKESSHEWLSRALPFIRIESNSPGCHRAKRCGRRCGSD